MTSRSMDRAIWRKSAARRPVTC